MSETPASASRAPDHKTVIETVQATWAELLGLDAFGPHDDFFDMGGHSLKAANAVARLGSRLGIDLPVRALLAAPTPAEMAELIIERQRKEDDRPMAGITPFFPAWTIPLQTEGHGKPVFVFPAGHDERMAMAIEGRVARQVGRDHPFWGFRRDDPGLDGPRMDGVSALVAAYVAQIRLIQGGGPYLLYGNCVGGYLAWETARQLLDLGETIAGILFFETPLHPDLARPASDHRPAPPTDQWRLSRSYRPQPLPVDLTHLVTGGWHARGWATPWREVVLGSVATVVIPGETEATFHHREERIARHIREWIAQTEARRHGT